MYEEKTQLETEEGEYTSLAYENDANKDFDIRFLTTQTYRSNLIWILSVLSNITPVNIDAVKALLISAFTTHNDHKYKVHVFLNGEYAAGKTYLATTVRDLLPLSNQVVEPKTRKPIPKVSPKAIFYSTLNKTDSGKDKDGKKVYAPNPTLYSNRVAYLDDVTTALQEMLKDLTNTTGDIPSHTVTSRENNGTKTMTLDGKPVIWASTVEGFTDEQVTSRFYKVEVEKKIGEVHKVIMINASSNGRSEEELKSIHSNLQKIKEFIAARINIHCEYNLPIEMLNKLPIPKDSNRNSDFSIEFLKCIAKINSHDLTKVITPTEEDLIETINMFKGKSASLQVNGVSANAKVILEFISIEEPNPGDMNQNLNPSGQTIEALKKTSPYSHNQLQRAIEELKGKNMIVVNKNKFGKQYFYKI